MNSVLRTRNGPLQPYFAAWLPKKSLWNRWLRCIEYQEFTKYKKPDTVGATIAVNSRDDIAQSRYRQMAEGHVGRSFLELNQWEEKRVFSLTHNDALFWRRGGLVGRLQAEQLQYLPICSFSFSIILFLSHHLFVGVHVKLCVAGQAVILSCVIFAA